MTDITELFQTETERGGDTRLPLTGGSIPKRVDSVGAGWWVPRRTPEERIDLMLTVLSDEATSLLYDSLSGKHDYPFAEVFAPLLAHIESVRDRLMAVGRATREAESAAKSD